MPQLSLHSSFDRLPADTQRIFDAARLDDFALGGEWFRNVVENGLPRQAKPCFAVLSRGPATAAIVPLVQQPDGSLGSLTNCYTCVYTPLIAGGLPLAETARLLGRELGRFCAGCWPIVRLDALPPEWPALEAFVAGLGEAGLLVRRFANFANWQEAVAGRSWEAYLATRPGMLRELLRRKARQPRSRAAIEFETIREPGEVARGQAAYEAVYRHSWKPQEPWPLFNLGLMREAAGLGVLRLGIAWLRGEPIAAQLWTLAGGRATIMKLAHDRAHDASSPGTLLTAKMVETLIEEGVEAIDFGRGDDPYKRLWAAQKHQRIGLMLMDPRRLRGLAALARHDAGTALRTLRRHAPLQGASP